MSTDVGDKIAGNFANKHILSLGQFTQQDLTLLFQKTEEIIKRLEKGEVLTTLAGKIITLLFFEPSSRTFGSFSAAVKRLGGQTLEFQNPGQTSSTAKGETLEDSVRTFAQYSDAMVMRHPETGSIGRAANVLPIPLMNAGDGGAGEHPTQALLDLFTIYKKFGKIDRLKILLAGDMLNGRTVHSLIQGLALFTGIQVYLLSPEKLKMPEKYLNVIKNKIRYTEITSDKDIPTDCNVWYWTRVQKERFSDVSEYEKLKHAFILTKQLLEEKGNKNMIVMHPLPRVGEIEEAVDTDSRAIYLTKQMRNGMYVRMALLSLILK